MTAVFEWTPNLTPNNSSIRQYYFYVEIDPEHALDEVHEERYGAGSTINDYSGNNTGFYTFYVYNMNDVNASGADIFASHVRTADDEMRLTLLYFIDGDGTRINDMAIFIRYHSDESFVTITANFTYSSSEAAYAFLQGCVLTQSGS